MEGPSAPASSARQSLYLQGQLWGPHHLSVGVWGWGSQLGHQLVVRQAGLRLRLIRSFATKHPMAPSGLTCRPCLLPMPTSGQSVAETLQAMELRWVVSMQPNSRGTARLSWFMELRWVVSMQPDSRGTARLSPETSASLPAWMTPSQTPSMHWSAFALSHGQSALTVPEYCGVQALLKNSHLLSVNAAIAVDDAGWNRRSPATGAAHANRVCRWCSCSQCK